MEYQTYQAIVSEQKFSGGLFLKIPYPTSSHFAVVLTDGIQPPITIHYNLAAPDRKRIRKGQYQKCYEVDISAHDIAFALELRSQDGISLFQAEAYATVEVNDPAQIVERNIRDVASVVKNVLISPVEQFSKRFLIEDFRELEEDLNRNLHAEIASSRTLPGLSLHNFRVSVHPDSDYLEVAKNEIKQRHSAEKAASIAEMWRNPRARAYQQVLTNQMTAAEAETAGFNEQMRQQSLVIDFLKSAQDTGNINPETADALLSNLLTSLTGNPVLQSQNPPATEQPPQDEDDEDDPDDF